jgi:1-acyl-sn-glycerol-3-phosphate acyltransferase
MNAPLGVQIVRTAGIVRQITLTWAGAVMVGPRLTPPDRQAVAVRLARRTLRTLGVQVHSQGAPAPRGEPFLLVANHISWLDVYVLNAFIAARFVAKSEASTWPVLGSITRGFEAIFIVRGSFRDAARVRGVVATALGSGERVVVFPEATTTDGSTLRRFHPALFQAAIDARVPVLPVAIRYRRRDGSPAPEAAFIDDMTFAGSLARIVRAGSLRAELAFGPLLASSGRPRRELAALARGFVAERLRLSPGALEPEAPARPARMKRAG